MSAVVRQALADAASTVDGLTGHAYFVQATGAGNVLIRHERTEYPNAFGGVVRWNVVLLLPQDPAAAEKYAEEKAPLLREAVSEHLVVTTITPQRMDLPGVGVVPCLFINGHREED